MTRRVFAVILAVAIGLPLVVLSIWLGAKYVLPATLNMARGMFAAEPPAISAPAATPTPIDVKALAAAVVAALPTQVPPAQAGNSGSPSSEGSVTAGQPAVVAAAVQPQPQLNTASGQPAMAVAAPAPTGINVGGGVLVAGVPASVVPTKYGNGEASSSTCAIPGACWILRDPGVISADEPDDCGDNASCIVINPLTQVPLVQKTTDLLCSEGGYLQLSGATMTVSGDGWSFTLPRRERNGWLAEIRCPNGAPRDGVDSNLLVQVTIGEPGAGSAIRYPVPTEAGAFRSEVQTMEEVMTTHGSENCGGASDGCSEVSLFLFDPNDGAFAALLHTVEGGWVLDSTNVQ